MELFVWILIIVIALIIIGVKIMYKTIKGVIKFGILLILLSIGTMLILGYNLFF